MTCSAYHCNKKKKSPVAFRAIRKAVEQTSSERVIIISTMLFIYLILVKLFIWRGWLCYVMLCCVYVCMQSLGDCVEQKEIDELGQPIAVLAAWSY